MTENEITPAPPTVIRAIKDPTHPEASPRGGIVPPVETRFGQPGVVRADPHKGPIGASPRAALRRRLAKDKDEDGIGKVSAEVADALLDAAKAGDKEKVWCLATLIAEAEGKPQEHVEHTGVQRFVLRGPKQQPPAHGHTANAMADKALTKALKPL